MRTKLIAPLFILMVLVFSNEVSAYKLNHYSEGENVRAEALRRDVRLIPIAQAQIVAARMVGSSNIIFSNVELDNEAEKHPNDSDFRPVFKMKVISEGKGFRVDVDASTGQVLGVSQEY